MKKLFKRGANVAWYWVELCKEHEQVKEVPFRCPNCFLKKIDPKK